VAHRPAGPGREQVAGHLGEREALRAEVAADRRQVDTDLLDRQEVLYRFDDDMELLREAVQDFLDECPKRLAALRDALACGDCKSVERLAHALKGSVGNFAARHAIDAAQKLETIGREGRAAAGLDAYAELNEAIERVKPALLALSQSHGI